MKRQLVRNEDYSNSLPQLAYDPIQAEQAKAEQIFRESQKKKAKEDQQGEGGPPRSFNPNGYIPPSDNPEPRGSSERTGQPSSSSDVGASAKAHAVKARPTQPPSDATGSSSRARQPPNPPPSTRMSNEKGKSQQTDEGQRHYDKGQSYQTPFHPNKGEKGRGTGKSSKGYDKGQQTSYKGKGYGYQHSGGWEWHNRWT